jgi:hypothetical protein
VGVTFFADVVRVGPEGEIIRLDVPHAKFRMSSYSLYDLIEFVSDRKKVGPGREAAIWPWYFGHHDGTGREAPSAKNCFDPAAVLQSLQELERDLTKYERKLPARWEFAWKERSGQEVRAPGLSVLFKGRNCRLLGDDEGPWAKEMDPGPRQGVHHSLKDASQVTVQFPGDPAADVVVTYTRISVLADSRRSLAEFKQTCISAMQERALVFTQAG